MIIGADWTVLIFGLLMELIPIVISLVVLYFIIKKAVKAALKEHDEEKQG